MSLDYRTWGATQNCKGCRFWSEMIARAAGAGMQALCLSRESQFAGKYMPDYCTCEHWKSGHHGAIDEPCAPEDTCAARLYEIEEIDGGR